MISSNALMLLTPIFTGLVVSVTGLVLVWRINRYGRAFNWPPHPAKIDPPAIPRHEK